MDSLALRAALVVGLVVLVHYVLPKRVFPAWERRRRARGLRPPPWAASSAYRWTFIPVATILLFTSGVVFRDELSAQLAGAIAGAGIAHYAGRLAYLCQRRRNRRP